MATLGKLRDNSKPVIWFVIIAFVIGLAGVGIFSYISNNKLTIFGMSSPNSYSIAINGEAITHVDTGLGGSQNGLDYIQTFYGWKSAYGLPNSGPFKASSSLGYTSSNSEYHDIDIYERHLETTKELKGRVLTDKLYKKLFDNELSDSDILMFMITELKNLNSSSNVASFSPINRIANTLNSTYFIGFEEEFTDLPDGERSPSERFEDFNNNGRYDFGEDFTDSEGNGIRDNDDFFDTNENGIWDTGEIVTTDTNNNGVWELENFVDQPNGIWDEGEEFTDTNNNEVWDDGEELLNDKGDGVWDNGRDKWLEHCIDKGEIDYTLIHNQNLASNLENYINAVASYHIKNRKYELAFNSMKYDSEMDKEQNYLLDNSNALISYISYNLNNLPKEDIDAEINDEKIKSEIPGFRTIEMGYFSNAFLIIVLILFIIFSIKNRTSKGLLSLGVVFSFLLGLIVIFKLKSDSTQGTEQYKEISYVYLKINSDSEEFTDKGNGIWDEGEEFTDTNENGFWDQELLTKDLNGNGILELDQGDLYNDANNNGKRDEEPLTDKGNNTRDIGEDFTDSNKNGVWDSKESIAQLKFEELMNQIETSDFNAIYDAFEDRKDEEIILSKQFTQENLDNLNIKVDLNYTLVDGEFKQNITDEAKIFGSIIFELLETVFKTDKNSTFIIHHNNPNDGALEGYIIGYVSDEGNYFEKTEYNKLKEKHLDNAKNTILVRNGLLEEDLFAENINAILSEDISIAEVIQNYSELNINFEHDTGDLPTASLIKGYISQMEAGEVSEVIIEDNVAYVIYMIQPTTDEGLFISEDYAYSTSYVSFKDFFNNIRNHTEILDWRNESYYMIPNNNLNQETGNITDIYFNLNNFESTLKTSLGVVNFNIK